MASENVEIVRPAMRRSREVTSSGSSIHPSRLRGDHPARARGRARHLSRARGVRRYFESFYEIMDDIRFEPESFREVGDKVVVEFTLSAKGKSSGLEVEQKAVRVWELKDGQAIGVDVYATLEEALAVEQGGDLGG